MFEKVYTKSDVLLLLLLLLSSLLLWLCSFLTYVLQLACNKFLTGCTRWILFWIMAAHLISKANKNRNNNSNKSDGQCKNTCAILFVVHMHFLNFISRDSVRIDVSRETEKSNPSNQCDNNACISIDKTHSTPMRCDVMEQKYWIVQKEKNQQKWIWYGWQRVDGKSPNVSARSTHRHTRSKK